MSVEAVHMSVEGMFAMKRFVVEKGKSAGEGKGEPDAVCSPAPEYMLYGVFIAMEEIC